MTAGKLSALAVAAVARLKGLAKTAVATVASLPSRALAARKAAGTGPGIRADAPAGTRARGFVVPAAIAATALLAAFIALLAFPAGRRGPVTRLPEPMNTEYLRLLVLPGPAPGETPFPLAFERKTGYTEADVELRRPDLGALDMTELERDRKAELEAVYETVD